MNQKSNSAGRARASAIPAATLRETAIDPIPALKAANDTMTSTVTQGLNTVINSTQDFVATGKANLDAVNASGKIWAAGVQDLTKQFAATVQASYAESVEAFKALTAAKSLKDVIALQSTYSKVALEKLVAETTKATQASIRLTEQALAPLKARVAVTVETFAKAA